MTHISTQIATRRPTTPQSMKPLFKEGETVTVQDSVFFRRSDRVSSNDWACHMDRFKGIEDKDHPDYMPRAEGLLAASASMAAGVATSLITAPYSATVIGPVLVGTALWAGGKTDDGLFSTIGKHLTLPVTGAAKVADTVFEKVAGGFYEGNGATLTYHQDESGKIWGIPHDRRDSSLID